MKLSKNTIDKIIFDGGKNIYALGLSLKDGKISRIKFYNKIYARHDDYTEFLGRISPKCRADYFDSTDEWMELYPGFSGFTVGIELSKQLPILGYGYKTKINNKLVFKAKYVMPTYDGRVAEEEYEYLTSLPSYATKKKMRTEYIEAKVGDKAYCYCPKIGYDSVLSIEDDVKFSLSEKNRRVFCSVKECSAHYLVLNYGKNRTEEKIYVLNEENNRNIDKLIDLTDSLSAQKLLTNGLAYWYSSGVKIS